MAAIILFVVEVRYMEGYSQGAGCRLGKGGGAA